MNDRGEESLARKIYLELLSKENLEVIEPERASMLVRKALQLAATFREATRTAPLEPQAPALATSSAHAMAQAAAQAAAPRRSRPAPESFARREERRLHDRELTPASTLLRRSAPLAEIKNANEPTAGSLAGNPGGSRAGPKPIQQQPLE